MKTTVKQQLKSLLILSSLIILLLTVVVPQQFVLATTGVSAAGEPAFNASLQGDFLSLKASLNRNEKSIAKLTKNRARLLTLVDRLRDKNNKKWIEMRVLYYDFNSSYQLAISHAYESRLLIKNHPGFTASGKVENVSMARWTVQRLRGAVTGLIARIDECNSIMGKANRLLKSSK